MTALCPACGKAMREVAAATSSGYAVALDQCPGCGGIWCDRWELYPLRADAAVALDAPAPQRSDIAPPRVDANLKCPRCSVPLRRWVDVAWPADADVARCVTCEGLWLSRGQLRRIKAAHLDDQPRLQPGTASVPLVVRNLDAALHSEVDEEFSSLAFADLWKGSVWVAARLLVRALLGL